MEERQKRKNQAEDFFDHPDCKRDKVLQLYDSLGKYYDQVNSSSGGSRISQGALTQKPQ